MPKRSRPSIPQELLEIKAQQIYEQRLPKNKNGSPEGDWEKSRRYLSRYPKVVGKWKLWKWTGISEKKGWDLLQLIINLLQLIISASIPFILVFGTQYFTRENNKQQQEIATNRYQQETLTKYFEQMSHLLLDKKLRQEEGEARTIARARTLSTLRELDNFRKGLLIKYLVEAKLVSGEKPVISLVDADLRNANLRNANLRNANLEHADLRNANLRNTNLISANLEHADLRNANLEHADLRNANFIIADLRNANLRNADLRNANFISADLRNANLISANLEHADLGSTKSISNKRIKSTCSWEKAIYTDAQSEWNETEKQVVWEWIAVDEKANQKRIEEIKQDKASDPKTPPDCDQWK